jgi:hypothetical protein
MLKIKERDLAPRRKKKDTKARVEVAPGVYVIIPPNPQNWVKKVTVELVKMR